MTRYIQRQDGEGFEIPQGKIFRLACCDCGLVHDFVVVVEDGELGMAARRNNRATAQRRRKHTDRRDTIKPDDDTDLMDPDELRAHRKMMGED